MSTTAVPTSNSAGRSACAAAAGTSAAAHTTRTPARRLMPVKTPPARRTCVRLGLVALDEQDVACRVGAADRGGRLVAVRVPPRLQVVHRRELDDHHATGIPVALGHLEGPAADEEPPAVL